MGRRPRVDRSPEEKWQIVQEGIKSGNVSETCRRRGIFTIPVVSMRDEAKAAWGKSAAAGETEQRIRQLEPTLAPSGDCVYV